MPVLNRTYGDKAVRPYLIGLLPGSIEARRSVGREMGVLGNNPFALLSHIGLDCPGVVQLCDEGSLQDALGGEGCLQPVAEVEIAGRLAEMLAQLAVTVPSRLEEALVEYGYIPGVAALGERVLSKTALLCERSLARLEE